VLTVRLRSGVLVVAKPYKGLPSAVTYANVTQAERRAAEIPGAYVIGHRPYYVVVPAPAGSDAKEVSGEADHGA
jgi:hypothetical protein